MHISFTVNAKPQQICQAWQDSHNHLISIYYINDNLGDGITSLLEVVISTSRGKVDTRQVKVKVTETTPEMFYEFDIDLILKVREKWRCDNL